MIEVKSIEYIDREEWIDLLSHSSTSSYFQSPQCYEFFSSLSFMETFGWGIFEDGRLKALACGYIIANGKRIKQFFSRRAVIHGGLLLSNDASDTIVSELLNKLKRVLSSKAIFIEIRNNSNFENYKLLFQQNNFNYCQHLNYIVETSNKKSVNARYSESKIRQIRKSKEQGVVCELSKSQQDVDEFYRILFDLYRKKIRKPLFPKEFFDKFVHQPNCYLFIVKKDEKVIGGIACAALSGKTLYEWFVCGDTKKFNHLYPSVAATHKGIEFATENDFEHFDFMGAGKPNVEYGVRNFKEKFGGKSVEYGRFLFISKKTLYLIGKLVLLLMKKKNENIDLLRTSGTIPFF